MSIWHHALVMLGWMLALQGWNKCWSRCIYMQELPNGLSQASPVDGASPIMTTLQPSAVLVCCDIIAHTQDRDIFAAVILCESTYVGHPHSLPCQITRSYSIPSSVASGTYGAGRTRNTTSMISLARYLLNLNSDVRSVGYQWSSPGTPRTCRDSPGQSPGGCFACGAASSRGRGRGTWIRSHRLLIRVAYGTLRLEVVEVDAFFHGWWLVDG